MRFIPSIACLIITLVFVGALESKLHAQVNLEKMDEIRSGLVRLRQACLDSLHQSLAVLPKMRALIEEANIYPSAKAQYLHFYLGEPLQGSSEDLNEAEKYPNREKKISDTKLKQLALHKLSIVQPKMILNTMAEYGQVVEEYPHALEPSNFFYGIFSFFDFRHGQRISIQGGRKSSFYSMILSVYLKNATIAELPSTGRPLINYFGRDSKLFGNGTRIQRLWGEDAMDLGDRDKFLLIDLFERDKRKELLKQAYEDLKPGGELCWIETTKHNLKNFSRYDNMITAGKVKRLARRAGFRLIEQEDLGLIRLYKFKKR